MPCPQETEHFLKQNNIDQLLLLSTPLNVKKMYSFRRMAFFNQTPLFE